MLVRLNSVTKVYSTENSAGPMKMFLLLWAAPHLLSLFQTIFSRMPIEQTALGEKIEMAFISKAMGRFAYCLCFQLLL